MSIESNARLVERFFEEMINRENAAIIPELMHPDVIIHDPFMGTLCGIEAFHQLIGIFNSAFPSHRVKVEQTIAQGDLVAALHTHYATHTGPFMGMAPTHREIVVTGLELFRIEDDQVVEFWRKDDDAGMLMQLGALPAPSSA
ncbi:MAG TPA: ester cyclase [Caldilineaceae bacterium]|nr:ester cyclase [Caldilineaceae bacterium]